MKVGDRVRYLKWEGVVEDIREQAAQAWYSPPPIGVRFSGGYGLGWFRPEELTVITPAPEPAEVLPPDAPQGEDPSTAERDHVFKLLKPEIGDRVRVIDKTSRLYGHCGEVRRRTYADDRLIVRFDSRRIAAISSRRLEVIPPAPATAPAPGYHLAAIPRGTFGEVSKIVEEALELQDAKAQGVRIMELVEAADLLGAIEGWLEKKHPGVTFEDLRKMAAVTKRAFVNGQRAVRTA